MNDDTKRHIESMAAKVADRSNRPPAVGTALVKERLEEISAPTPRPVAPTVVDQSETVKNLAQRVKDMTQEADKYRREGILLGRKVTELEGQVVALRKALEEAKASSSTPVIPSAPAPIEEPKKTRRSQRTRL